MGHVQANTEYINGCSPGNAGLGETPYLRASSSASLTSSSNSALRSCSRSRSTSRLNDRTSLELSLWVVHNDS